MHACMHEYEPEPLKCIIACEFEILKPPNYILQNSLINLLIKVSKICCIMMQTEKTKRVPHFPNLNTFNNKPIKFCVCKGWSFVDRN